MKKVIVIGLDGFEPKIVDPLLRDGELPNLARLVKQGGFSRVQTTYPAQTPVAWSTFATGTNPGGHGIFDFIRRDPKTYLPDLSMNRYEQKSAFLPPKAVNLRGGVPLWELLSSAGITSSIVRFPCTYPPDNIRGRMLAGMGVPDLRGGLGTSTFYTSGDDTQPQESENVLRVQPVKGQIKTHIIGPRNPKTAADFEFEITIELDAMSGTVTIFSDGQPQALKIREGEWSPWLKVKFKTGMLQSVKGMVRFHLVQIAPVFELYCSPVNFDPEAPMFPLSSPPDYARDLAQRCGTFYTTGMVEDHGGLNNGRFSEFAYLDQCEEVLREREKMMVSELERLDQGFFFCLFDTPDRVQHMFWRFGEQQHPANHGRELESQFAHTIEEHYRSCDEIVGEALEYADDKTLFIALSDHGMSSFQRGVHLNTWLRDQGLLTLNEGIRPGEEAGDFFKHVDWSRTKAYALGLSGIYLNLKGREEQGIVAADVAQQLKASIAKGLAGLPDPDRGKTAVRSVSLREDVYNGPYADCSPDLVVNYNEGYRVSWGTALGGVPTGHFEDNEKKWGGDHIIDPSLVPGVLFMNQPFNGKQANLRDLAPTILDAFGLPAGEAMEGESLLI